MQIIVLGMHRSGTSLLTRIINLMSAYVGPENSSIGFNDENPKGFWERADVIEINDALLALQECRWNYIDGWNPDTLPQKEKDEQLTRLKKLLLEIDAHRPWVIKDPRLCLTFSLWRPLLEVPVCVIMQRDPIEVAHSLATRNGLPLIYGLALWEAYTVSMLNSARGLPCIFLQHDSFSADPLGQSKKLYDALIAGGCNGLRMPSEQEILAFYDPLLHRSKRGRGETSENCLSSSQQQLAEYASGTKPLPAEPLTVSFMARQLLGFDRLLWLEENMAAHGAVKESGNKRPYDPWIASVELKELFIAEQEKEIQLLSEILEKQALLLEALQHSMSWRLGQKMTGAVHWLQGKYHTTRTTIFEEASSLLERYANWKNARE